MFFVLLKADFLQPGMKQIFKFPGPSISMNLKPLTNFRLFYDGTACASVCKYFSIPPFSIVIIRKIVRFPSLNKTISRRLLISEKTILFGDMIGGADVVVAHESGQLQQHLENFTEVIIISSIVFFLQSTARYSFYRKKSVFFKGNKGVHKCTQ